MSTLPQSSRIIIIIIIIIVITFPCNFTAANTTRLPRLNRFDNNDSEKTNLLDVGEELWEGTGWVVTPHRADLGKGRG